jgi:signal transduction histidine kinase
VAYASRHGASAELIGELEADARRLARLADDLLALSREEASAPAAELVRLDELAREAGSAEGIDVVAPEPVTVRGDRRALERALANLTENARLHGPADGRITIEVGARDDVATLSVVDEGPGLQPYESERAFGRFWRGHTDSGGSGLGLAIVRATAERHGGRAYADGARFTIELPLLRDVSEPPATTTGDESEQREEERTIGTI